MRSNITLRFACIPMVALLVVIYVSRTMPRDSSSPPIPLSALMFPSSAPTPLPAALPPCRPEIQTPTTTALPLAPRVPTASAETTTPTDMPRIPTAFAEMMTPTDMSWLPTAPGSVSTEKDKRPELPDLILTMAVNYGPETLRPMVLTWAEHARDNTRLVLLTNTIGLSDLREFKDIGPELFLRVQELGSGPVVNRRLHASRQYLEDHRDAFGRVLIIDSRDVLFQRNPFRHPLFPKEGEVGFTLEGGMRPIGLEHYNREWISTCYGEGVRKRMENLTISNSGFIMSGDLPSALQYLDMVLWELDEGEAGKCVGMGGADQAVHNYLAYMRDTPFRRVILDNEVSPCYTVGGDFTMYLNGLNQVLNRDGQVVSVVHQYDRRAPFLAFIEDSFRLRVRSLTRFQEKW